MFSADSFQIMDAGRTDLICILHQLNPHPRPQQKIQNPLHIFCKFLTVSFSLKIRQTHSMMRTQGNYSFILSVHFSVPFNVHGPPALKSCRRAVHSGQSAGQISSCLIPDYSSVILISPV